MYNLSLDANVYLKFYYLSSDDLNELEKLLLLVQTSKAEIRLFLPEQTQQEFLRNREKVLSNALKRFKENKLNNEFPQICQQYPEYMGMRAAITEYDKKKAALTKKLDEDISQQILKADILIKKLFARAELIKTTPELIILARNRFDFGNPPGKDGSYGDALNWESLLKEVPHSEPLYFISGDKDFYSALDENKINGFLNEEWKTQKESELYSYMRMAEFFSEKFPHIKIATEYEREQVAKELGKCSSFSAVHITLNKLSQFDSFADSEMDDIVKAFLYNDQVSMISTDSDVKRFIIHTIVPREKQVNASLWVDFTGMYRKKPVVAS